MGLFNISFKKPELNDIEKENEKKKENIRKHIDSCNDRLNSITTLEETDKINDAFIITKHFIVDLANLLFMLSGQEKVKEISQIKADLDKVPDSSLANQLAESDIFNTMEKESVDEKEMRKLSDSINEIFAKFETKAVEIMKEDLRTPLDDYKRQVFVKFPAMAVCSVLIVLGVIFGSKKLFSYLEYKSYISKIDKLPVYAQDITEKDFIKDWLILGKIPSTFSRESFETDLLDNAGGETRILPQEGMPVTLRDGSVIKWIKLSDTEWFKKFGERYERIMLLKAIGKADNCVAYAFTTINSPQEKKVTLAVGSDDGVMIWLNGALVHNKHVSRPCYKDLEKQDKIDVTLRKGTNAILMKISQQERGWAYCFRILGI